MSDNGEEISVEILTNRYTNHDFQWIKGENLMNVVSFDTVTQQDDQFYIHFKGGSRINYNILEEYMTWYPAQRVEPRPAPTPAPQSQASVSSIKFGDTGATVNEASQSPIYNLLARQKKKPVEIEFKIKVPLPSKDLFNVLTSSFDDYRLEDAMDMKAHRRSCHIVCRSLSRRPPLPVFLERNYLIGNYFLL